MKRLPDLLAPEEREQHDKSLDASAAPTEAARKKTQTVRTFLDERCFFEEEAEERWAQSPPNARRRVLAELLWRTGCILDKSSTAVVGLNKFDLGHGFKLLHTEVDGKEALVIV